MPEAMRKQLESYGIKTYDELVKALEDFKGIDISIFVTKIEEKEQTT